MIAGDLSDIIEQVGGKAQTEWDRLSFFNAYYTGVHRTPYQPATATAEFVSLVMKATTNLTRLVVGTMTQRLIVDGFKASKTAIDNSPAWEWWQANGLDSRQKALYDEVATYGYAYGLVLPGEPFPVMRPISPRTWYAEFDDFDDDWATVALRRDPNDSDVWQLMDDETIRTVRRDGASYRVVTEVAHGLGRVPLVPYRNERALTRRPTGEVEPVIPVQDRLNQTVFDLLVAQTYAAAPQKWIAGLSAPTDEDGQPIIDLRSFAKSVWIDPDPTTKFGSLPEANLSNIVKAIESTLRVYGLLSQTPPHYLLGDMVNLSAEALLAADTTMAKKVQDRQALHGESHEQFFRLAGVAAGDPSAADDQEAQVWWRDTEPRSIAQVVDALGKLAVMLQVPVEALWEKVPGITRGDLEEWRMFAARERLREPQTPQPAPTAQTPATAPAGRENAA